MTDAELAALTADDAPPPACGGRVLILSPYVADHEAAGRALRDLGYAVIGCEEDVPAPPDGGASLAAVVVAVEVLDRHAGTLARLRGISPALPVYVVGDAVAAAAPPVAPPSGAWARASLAQFAALALGPARPAASPGDDAGQTAPESDVQAHVLCMPGPDGARLAPGVYAGILETLLAPASDARALAAGMLPVLREAFGAPAAGVLVSEGDFFVAVDGATAALRARAGKWLLDNGASLAAAEARRLRPNAFAAVDVAPLEHGGHALGAMCLFWTHEGPQPDAAAACTRMACRLWELLGRAAPEAARVPFAEWVARARAAPARRLVIAAPVREALLETLLEPGDIWAREPAGACVCLLAGEGRRLCAGLASVCAGFSAEAGAAGDLQVWVRDRSRALELLRAANRRGIIAG